MHIDWFVFFAQIFNFLLLVYLLKRFLYGRIVAAMDAREAKIARRHEEAEQAKLKAIEEAQAYERKNRELAEVSDRMIQEARAEADAHKADLMNTARKEVDLIRQHWVETLARQQASFVEELRRRAGQQIYAIARKALSDLADTDLEQEIVNAFIKRLEAIEDEDARSIRDTMGTDSEGIVIQSAFAMPPPARDRIKDVLARYHINGAPIRYEVSDEVLSGIEMRTAGHKISWSFNDYLNSLEENFSRALQEASAGRA